MATISITIPDAIATRVMNAMAAQYGYQAEITNEDGTKSPNPQTKAQFAKARVIEFIKNNVRNYEAEQAVNTARVAATEDAEIDITLS